MRALVLPISRGIGMRMQKSAEGIVGWGQGAEPGQSPIEGLNIEQRK
jgi:hypothetical protein